MTELNTADEATRHAAPSQRRSKPTLAIEPIWLEWLTLALTSDHAADAQVRAEALRAAGVLAWAIADNPQAHRWLAQGLKLAQGLPDRQPEAAIYIILGIVARSEGAFAQACTAFELARTISATLADPYATRFAIMGLAEIDMRLRKLNDAVERYRTCVALNSAAGDAVGIAASTRRLANAYCRQGSNNAAAAALCSESMALCRAVGDQQGLGQTHLVLGNLARDQRDYARATEHYRASLLLRKQLGQREDCAQTLEALAVSLARTGEQGRAVQLVSGARQLRMALRAPLTAFEQETLDAVVAVCRAQLGDAPFAEHWRRGETLTLDQMTGQESGVRSQESGGRGQGAVPVVSFSSQCPRYQAQTDD